MNPRTVRAVAPMVYGLAVVVGFLIGGGVGTAVAVVGAMLLGILYVALRPDVAPGYDRSASRAARAERRAG